MGYSFRVMARKKARDISELAEVVSSTPVVETVVPVVETIPATDSIPSSAIPVEDRVNNQGSKELAMSKAGVTRRRTYEVICELLSAVKRVVGYDSRGMEVVSEEPDLDKRKMGAELALKAFGDLKEMKDVGGQVTYNTVVYQWKK